jgi:glycosyltransferase involved in cell wall biosynthesis
VADAGNTNAQAKNVQGILAYWAATNIPATLFGFGAIAPRIESNPNVRVLRIKPDQLWPLRLTFEYQRQFSAIVNLGLHHWSDWVALWLRRISGRRIPVVCTLEGLLGLDEDRDHRASEYSAAAGHAVYCQSVPANVLRQRDWILMRALHIIALSPFLRRMGEIRYGRKFSVLPLGIDDAVFHARNRSVNARPVVVCAGGVRRHKRPETFLHLASQFPQADFVWYGDGNQREPLTARTAALGLRNLRFAGAVAAEELARSFRSSDIMVLPSLSEGVPKITQEAAACGLAQIVFGHYETPTVVDGDNGYVVHNDDELQCRLGELIDNPALRRRMGEAGVEMAQKWPWQRIAPLWQEHILQLVQ